MELGKTSYSVYKIRYHIVTAVKYRKALLNKEVEQCIKETLYHKIDYGKENI